jgi:hypothetical protein
MSSGINQNILNFLRRRYEISKIEIAGTEVIQLYFNNGEVIINSLQNRKQMELKILYYLEDNGYIDMNTFFSNERSPEMVSVIRTVRKFLNEVMTQSIKESFEEQSKGPYVVFVSGLTSRISHKSQVDAFKNGFSGNNFKDFNYTKMTEVNQFIKNNNVKAVVLFSKACEFTQKVFGISKSQIYCVEPYNCNGDKGRYEGISAKNMFINYKDCTRGKNAKEGANDTSKDGSHLEALTKSVSKISF